MWVCIYERCTIALTRRTIRWKREQRCWTMATFICSRYGSMNVWISFRVLMYRCVPLIEWVMCPRHTLAVPLLPRSSTQIRIMNECVSWSSIALVAPIKMGVASGVTANAAPRSREQCGVRLSAEASLGCPASTRRHARIVILPLRVANARQWRCYARHRVVDR